MDKGAVFEKDGIVYEICQDGTEYRENQKNCILPPGKTKCILIQKALNQELIKIFRTEKGDLFRNDNQLDPQNIEDYNINNLSCPARCTNSPKTHTESGNIYYMPVDQLRARVFLAHGLIYPAIYDKAGLSVDFHDSQRETPARLRLYAAPQPLYHNQLLLRILLKQEEVNAAIAESNGEVLHLDIPLPISRLAGIEVPSVAGDLDHYTTGWITPDLPVPRHLFINATVPLSPDQENLHWQSLPSRDIQPRPDVAESIIRFDRYLGVMAFMRNVGRYFSENTGYYTDYPEVFFSTCERIMHKSNLTPAGCPTPPPLLLALLGFNISTMPETISSLLDLVNSQATYISKNKDDKAYRLAKEICKATDEQKTITLERAFKALFYGGYRDAISHLQGLDMPIEAAVLAGLIHFSAQSHGYRLVKQRLHEDWSDQNQVYMVLAALGAYYGYTTLDAREYKLYSVHPLIDSLLRDEYDKYPEIKFHLRTRFERELVEAIYQRAFFPNKPIQDSSSLFSTVITQPQPQQHLPDIELSGLPIHATNYKVQDLVVRQYKVTSSENSAQASARNIVVSQHETTPIEKFIQHLRTWKRDVINDQSKVGIWLMGPVYRYAERFKFNFEKGGSNPIIGYSITKKELIKLIEDRTITFELKALEFLEELIKEDNAQ